MEEARDEGARPDQDVPHEEEQVEQVKDVMVDDQESDDGSFHADSQSDNECDSEDDDIDEEQNEDNTLRDDIPEDVRAALEQTVAVLSDTTPGRVMTRSAARRSSKQRTGAALHWLWPLVVLAIAIGGYFMVLGHSVPPSNQQACGVETSHRFALLLDKNKGHPELRYPKADYAPASWSENVDQVANVLHVKSPNHPAVMLFVSSEDRKDILARFTHKLHNLYYNISDSGADGSFRPLSEHLVERVVAMLKHFDIMETALEDSVAFIDDGSGKLHTNGAIFIVVDTLNAELLRRFKQDPARDINSAIQQHMFERHKGPQSTAQWTPRFNQRIQDTVIF